MLETWPWFASVRDQQLPEAKVARSAAVDRTSSELPAANSETLTSPQVVEPLMLFNVVN
jgi:hypothetical protein